MSAAFLRTLFVLASLAVAAAGQPAMAQNTLVLVPDTPNRIGTAVTTTNLNVRSGPGTGHAVINVLQRGETVDLLQCLTNWCQVAGRGPIGWASRSHLRELLDMGGPPSLWPDLDFDFGPNRVCFYEETNFRGRRFCVFQGESDPRLGSWDNRIASIRVQGRDTVVDVCTSRNFRNCTLFGDDAHVLSRSLHNNISSFRVW